MYPPRSGAQWKAAAGELGVELVVVHPGSHGGDGEEKGMNRLVGELDRIRVLAASFAGSAGQVAEPVVENSVGAGTQLCSSLDSLGEVARRAGCVDMAHAFVAGYDLSTPGWSRRSSWPQSRLLCYTSTTRKTSWEAVATGTEIIGEGQIPLDSWPELFAGLPGIPVAMDTPHGSPEEDAREVRLVKKLAGGLRKAPKGI